ncbi:glycoside hydrolase [Chloropicon primus]|uniref:cellulase n=1 Tax=Chloropicon primus TaxID=1764295 RepID=A0A5B8MR45_9CHLO|nr:glycoside hydrolase [Chloropicon primus]|eukprot:QDZ22956.1 glycoside hydrolase [Chloropicon primus]
MPQATFGTCLVFLLLSMFSSLRRVRADVSDYGNCGGVSTHPCAEDRACADCASPDFECDRQSEWYWQCLPSDSSSSAGCTDEAADNFDPLATKDDGSCEYTIYGCTFRSAANYDPLATEDDGSCSFFTETEAEETTDSAEEETTAAIPAAEETEQPLAEADVAEEATAQPLPEESAQQPSVEAAEETPTAEEALPQALPYKACGGINLCGADEECRSCSAGFTCSKSNEWYYQCVRETGEPTLPVPSAPTPAIPEAEQEPPSASAADYEACGGSDLCGSDEECRSCSSESFTCKRTNAFYHQCVPDDSAEGDVETEAETEAEVQEPTTAEPDSAFTTSEGLGSTTRFFDGCKASCSWEGNVGKTVSGVVKSCSNKFDDEGNQIPLENPNVKSVCGGGGVEEEGGSVAYQCIDQQPFNEGKQRYGFAASNARCCECYELTFQEGDIAGETAIVQVINEGGDLGEKQFDIQIPGGGYGIFNGATGSPPNGPPLFENSVEADWGQRYGGVQSREECFNLPSSVQPGCLWRWDSLGGADNPSVTYKRVKCGLHPKLYEKSGCLLAADLV